MPYKLSVSNKPNPEPAEPLFTKHKLSNGRTVWVSLPQLDKLSITIPVTKHLYGLGVSDEVPVSAYANSLGAYFKEEQQHAPCDGHLFPGGWRRAILKVGPLQSTVLIEHTKKGQNHSLRLEFNPTKVGPAGLTQLVAIFGDQEGKFKRSELVAHGKVTRLDVAIDIVGLHISDALLRHTKQGKRALYTAQDGTLESVYLHRARPVPSAKFDELGNPIAATLRSTAPLVRAYDLRRWHLDHALPAPYGSAEVSRIELVTRPMRVLAQLHAMANPYKYFRAGFVGSQLSDVVGLSAYQTTRRTARRDEARSLLGSRAVSNAFDDAESVPVADLAESGSWKGFASAMQLCGLYSFINDECN